MDKARKQRFQRIESLDQKRLDAATVELKKLNQKLNHRVELRRLLKIRLHELLTQQDDLVSLALKNQSVECASRLQSTIEDLDKHLVSLKKTCDEQMDAVRQQQAKVKGWSLLIEKIEAEQLESETKEAMFDADDRVLGKLSLDTRNST